MGSVIRCFLHAVNIHLLLGKTIFVKKKLIQLKVLIISSLNILSDIKMVVKYLRQFLCTYSIPYVELFITNISDTIEYHVSSSLGCWN